nr:serine/threonine protein phosphatase [Propionibacterium sp.]
MRTVGRLTEAYDAARLVEFDSTSKFVLLSDQHRGDGSRADEFAKNKVIFTRALNHYLEEGYTLIELGDSEDLWEFPHVRHIVKANGMVYSRIKKFFEAGRYLRLFGNHDAQLGDPRYVRQNLSQAPDPVSGEMVPLLPGLRVEEALRLRHTGTGQEIVVVHGHQGDFANDQNWHFTMFTFRIFWKWLHAFGIASPSSPIRNSYKRHKVERNYLKWIRQSHVALICGHTHRERFPRPDEAPYFNTGCCTFNGYITGLEIVDDQILLIGWRVEADHKGQLQVLRRILAGPQPIAAYDRVRVGGLTQAAEDARHAAIRAASRRVPARRDGPKRSAAERSMDLRS